MIEDNRTTNVIKDNKLHTLAVEHWDYVQAVILNSESNIHPRLLDTIGFHYITAFKHGYGHGYENCEKKIREDVE